MREADLDAVLAVESSSFASPWKREHFLAEMAHGEWARPQVVVQRGMLVAYAVVWEVAGELKINNLAVDPGRRGVGIGRWLLDRLLQHARQTGCVEATLEVRPTNRAAAALYRGFGFQVVGRRPGYYAREAEDALLMRLDLVAGGD